MLQSLNSSMKVHIERVYMGDEWMAAKVMLIRVRNELEMNLWIWRTDSTCWLYFCLIHPFGDERGE